MDKVRDFGSLSLTDGAIVYDSKDYGSWSLPVSSVRLIGELTNANGPWLDDWFVVFVVENKWREASFYASGRDVFLEALARKFPGLGSTELANSASLNSRVLWPPEHLGKPLFLAGTILPPPGASLSMIRSYADLVELRISPDLMSSVARPAT